MKRILIRAGKRPYDFVSPETTLALNTFGSNSGNYLFSTSAFRMLSRSDVEIVPFGLGIPKLSSDEINEQYDHLVLPMANAFRPDFMPALRGLTKIIRGLSIPVTILSVGAQAGTEMDTKQLSGLDESVKDFVGAVLDRSPRIGVRGEFTAEYLRKLGFKDVEAIGCPSFFLNGPSLDVRDPDPNLNYQSRISFSVTPGTTEMGPITMDHLEKFENLRLIPQDYTTLSTMLWGTEPKKFGPESDMPFHPRHRIFTEDKARYFVDTPPWMDYMKTIDFAFGDRIHGNVVPLLAGTPSFLLAHDSRVLELANHHKIPYMFVGEVTAGMDALDFAERADYTELRTQHPKNWEVFSRYLADQQLEHVFDDPQQKEPFDSRMANASMTRAVHAISGSPDSEQLAGRVAWLYRKQRASERTVNKLNEKIHALSKENAALVSKQTSLEQRIKKLEKSANAPSSVRSFLGRFKRKVRAIR